MSIIQWEDIKVKDENGQVCSLKFTPRKVKKHSEFTFRILIPPDIIGYQDLPPYATINYVSSDTGDRLYISPPEVRLTGEQLKGEVPVIQVDLEAMGLDKWAAGHEDDPFAGAVAYCNDVMEENEWGLDGWENFREFHYAFDERTVKNYDPALLEKVHRLRGPRDTSDTSIWLDRSHNQSELETDNLDVAREIDAVLNAEKKILNGELPYRLRYKK